MTIWKTIEVEKLPDIKDAEHFIIYKIGEKEFCSSKVWDESSELRWIDVDKELFNLE